MVSPSSTAAPSGDIPARAVPSGSCSRRLSPRSRRFSGLFLMPLEDAISVPWPTGADSQDNRPRVRTWASASNSRSGSVTAATSRFTTRRLRSVLSMWRASIRGRDLFVASIPVTASVFLAGYLLVRAEEAARQAFKQKAQELRALMFDRLSQPVESLAVIASFVEISGGVTREQFRLLAMPLLGRHRAVAAFEWLPWVRQEHRETFEAEAREAGQTDYRFWETGPDGKPRDSAPRPFHLPVHFMEPPSALALGFDIASDPTRLATAERSRDRGKLAASQPFILVQDT